MDPLALQHVELMICGATLDSRVHVKTLLWRNRTVVLFLEALSACTRKIHSRCLSLNAQLTN